MHIDFNDILKKYPKDLRKLNRLWTQVIKTENFIIPETIEDIKQIGIFSPKIKLKKTECYFNEKSKVLLSEFINTLYGINDFNQFLSYNSISSKTIKYIEKSIADKIDQLPQPTSSEIIKNLIGELISDIGKHEFFRLVMGIELNGLQSVTFGNVELFIFGKKQYKSFRKYRAYNNQNKFFDKGVISFLDKKYSEKICVKTFSVGDRKKAEKNAERYFRQVINMLRCLVCFKAYEKISENLAKINLLGETYDAIENGISINHDNKDITLHVGRGRKSIHKLPIDKESIHDLKSRFFLDDLCSLFTKEAKTEVEKAILTAMHWIGEAQDEFDLDSAFIKYWTALETLFSKSKQRLQKSIAKGVSIQLAYGGYGFIKPNEAKKCYKEVYVLYEKRSKIIHRGRYETVSAKELSSVCKYSIFSFFSFLGLRSIGYTKLEQVNKEINRLFNLVNYKYLTSKNSRIYHKLSCSIISKIQHNKIEGIVDDNDLIKSNKKPCRLCFK